MIKKVPHTEYIVVCDECGVETIGDFDAQKEIREAKEAGWKFTPRCFEQDIALCPDCQNKSK